MAITKKYPVLFTIVLPIIIAVALLYSYKKGIRDAEDIGLGKGTATFTPYVEKRPIHITNPSLAASMKEGWIERGKKEVYLWIGNSQLHGVNQYRTGQVNCISFLSEQLKTFKEEVLGISYPNGNMQEFLTSVLYFSKLIPPKGIILPICFDDMREDGIRDALKLKPVIDSVQNEPAYYSTLENIRSLKLPVIDSNSGANGNDFSGIKETLQDISERYLDRKMEAIWSIWKSRPDIRGNLFNDLYNFRNTMFGIDATTTRKMIPGRYKDNFTAFTSIIKYCTTNKISLLIYIPPIRNDVPIPYEHAAYNSFKKDVEEQCLKSGVSFVNLENLVPGQYWGQAAAAKAGDEKKVIDFMHFQQSGHQLLADSIFKTISQYKNP